MCRQLIGASALTLAAIQFATPALAQEGEADRATQEHGDDHVHSRRVSERGQIVVTAAGLAQLDIIAGTSVLEGSELHRNLAGQLGDVLEKLPGVSSSGFSPGASRPVIRGFSGERVKVLVDGIGAIDASNTSDDHAVTIDPLTTERIEVLRGPAVILYGSQAIGGAVNVIDKRIPLRVPQEHFHLDTIFSADSATGLWEGAASLDVPLSSQFVAHINGSYRETGNIKVPGFTIAPGLRAELLATAEEEANEGELAEAEEIREAANQSGVLPNSAAQTWSVDAGFAFFSGESNLGVAAGIYDTLYGVPMRPGAGHHGEEEAGGASGAEEEGAEQVTINLRQVRADMRGTLALGDGFFSDLRVRAGFSDYTHTEFEGAEIGTVFDISGIEARAELVQNPRGNWQGTVGLQYYFRDFNAAGAEAYVPANMTDQIAIFALQEVGLGPVQIEGAARYEHTKVSANTLGLKRTFNTVSGAISLAHETEGGLRFGVTGSRAERAPSAEELLSNGPHIATQAFEIGDTNLATEKSWGLEASVRGRIGLANVNIAIFQSWFNDYIYLNRTGLEQDDLPVFQYLQGNVDYFGIEGAINVPLIESETFTLLADLRGDYIRAKLGDGTPLPRIPPLNILGALEAQTNQLDGRVEVQWFDSQNKVTTFEKATDNFTMVNASLAWRPFAANTNVTIMLQANNIFNTAGRRHTSFTKDFVPMAGRNFRVSVRTSF